MNFMEFIQWDYMYLKYDMSKEFKFFNNQNEYWENRKNSNLTQKQYKEKFNVMFENCEIPIKCYYCNSIEWIRLGG